MPSLSLVGTGALRWDEVPAPVISDPRQAIVRPISVATCDVDVQVLRGAFPIAGPYPFGHEGVGIVVETGENVRTVQAGDQVIIPFQMSCGACIPCMRGHSGSCADFPRRSAYGLGPVGGTQWGGFLADRVLVPNADGMLVCVPEGVDAKAVASASDNIPDAWRAVVPQLAAFPGAEVLIVGGARGPHSIGLYAVGLALAAGAVGVTYLDTDPHRLQIASQYGAAVIDGRPEGEIGSFPITVDANGTHDGLNCAINSTAPDGVCTSTSIYVKDPSLPMLGMYLQSRTLRTGWAHARAAIPAILALVANGTFDPALVTTAHADWSEAVDALSEPSMKTIISRADKQ